MKISELRKLKIKKGETITGVNINKIVDALVENRKILDKILDAIS